MKAINIEGQEYVVLTPEPSYTLVLLREQFIEGLKRAKRWSRRSRQAEREAQAAHIAEEARLRRLRSHDVLG